MNARKTIPFMRRFHQGVGEDMESIVGERRALDDPGQRPTSGMGRNETCA
jgi:hypothetical protein